MAGRPTIKQADLNAIAKLDKSLKKGVTDQRPLIAYVMRSCGCSYEEIGMAFGVTRQSAELIYKQAEERI